MSRLNPADVLGYGYHLTQLTLNRYTIQQTVGCKFSTSAIICFLFIKFDSQLPMSVC